MLSRLLNKVKIGLRSQLIILAKPTWQEVLNVIVKELGQKSRKRENGSKIHIRSIVPGDPSDPFTA
jgi:hypothetical protein